MPPRKRVSAQRPGYRQFVDTIITGHSSRAIGSGATAKFEPFGPVVKSIGLRDEAAVKYRDYDMANARNDVQRVYEESKP